MNKTITFGEMRDLTERFHQILGAAQCSKDRRLETLYLDIAEISRTTLCPRLLEFLYAILEESDVLTEKVYRCMHEKKKPCCNRT